MSYTAFTPDSLGQWIIGFMKERTDSVFSANDLQTAIAHEAFTRYPQ